jgi:L-aspartate oxidase
VSNEALPELMWQEAGLVRDQAGLTTALERLGDGSASPQHLVARLLCEAAWLREESRGAHHREDHPEAVDAWAGHVVMHKDRGRWFERA